MKVISIKQPWASLIANNIKNIENRTWRTNFRGRILIHATIRPVFNKTPFELLTKKQLKQVHEKYGYFFPWWEPKGAILGEVDIIDCVQNHPSIWAEKDCWNWVLANPVLYHEPILNVKGKLSFWEYDLPDHIHVPNKYGGHATFPTPPDQQTIDAVNSMAELAYKNLKRK